MTLLFAALDATGSVRFIGDVPRGLQSGCFCPTCGGPVIARRATAPSTQGTLRTLAGRSAPNAMSER